MKANKAKIEISNCGDCPFNNPKRVYTADSFEMIFSWHCKKKKDKKIHNYVEVFDDHNKIPIPDWCPIIVKK